MNLVIGFSTYTWDHCGVFVRSLRESGYEDDLILIGNSPGKEYEDKYRIRVEPSDKLSNLSRFEIYRRILQDGAWDRVFLTDVRDVVFQSDPFPMITRGLHVAEEDLLIGEQRHNRDRTMETFGREVFESLKDKRIICAGTIYGGRESVIGYLDAFSSLDVPGMDRRHQSDQPILMYLVHNGLLEHLGLVIDPNDGKHAVWTIGTRDETHHDDFYTLDNHITKMMDGHIPACIHQYDRHPRIVRAMEDCYLR